jgi:cation:H+ antiporter
MVLIAASIMYLFSLDGIVSRTEGIVLISVYLGYLLYLSRVEKIVEKVKLRKENPVLDFLIIAIGLIIIIYGANWVIENGVMLARQLNVGDVFIGILIGIGTSLPELSVSIKAVMKHSHRLSLGNMLGSNITDPLFSFGIGAAISGFSIEKAALLFYFPFWIIATLIALLMLFNHMNLNKKEGSVLILLYGLFVYLGFVLL